ncbi:hypothetical protein CFE70_001371 [Pyrenophora teres f. teres 0-1]|uniref:Uncharacterized protein n=2 Tax=Pyrenophora teres f. teres TaxID=97479 RepID=E3RPM3_PYRTT|nr:hypothetical protein PTT_10603 [Pyrenophora teres f. teres 0-1]
MASNDTTLRHKTPVPLPDPKKREQKSSTTTKTKKASGKSQHINLDPDNTAHLGLRPSAPRPTNSDSDSWESSTDMPETARQQAAREKRNQQARARAAAARTSTTTTAEPPANGPPAENTTTQGQSATPTTVAPAQSLTITQTQLEALIQTAVSTALHANATSVPTITMADRPDFKLAYHIMSQKDWPRLEGPHNYVDWSNSLESAAIAGRFASLLRLQPSEFPSVQDRLLTLEFIKQSLTPGIRPLISDLSGPLEALELLEERHKAKESAHVFSLFQRFINSSLDRHTDVTAFKDELNIIQNSLRAVHPRYVLPGWIINLWFLAKLGPEFDNRVSLLHQDKALIDPESPKNFDALASDIINEEHRKREVDTSSTTLVTRPSPANVRTTGPNGEPWCVHCNCPGHIYAKNGSQGPGKKYCYFHPAQKEEYARRTSEGWGKRGGRGKGPKRERGTSTADARGPYKRQVDTENFSQRTSLAARITYPYSHPEDSTDQ